MTKEQKEQIDDLISETIEPALVEDFVYKNKEEVEDVLSYLKKKVNEIELDDFADDLSEEGKEDE
jgi:hypothetical protein